jgi:hypothetical protein
LGRRDHLLCEGLAQPWAPVGTMQTGYPCIQTSSQDKEQGVHPRTAMCSVAPDLTPCRRGLRCCHVSCSSGPHLPIEVSLLCVPRPWSSPPCRGGLQRCHMSCSSGPLLPAKEGSGATVCPTAPDLASLLGWAPALPCAPWLFVGREPQI